jgi:hypothetical protein
MFIILFKLSDNFIQNGMKLEKENKYIGAIKCFDKAIQCMPTALSYYLKGLQKKLLIILDFQKNCSYFKVWF